MAILQKSLIVLVILGIAGIMVWKTFDVSSTSSTSNNSQTSFSAEQLFALDLRNLAWETENIEQYKGKTIVLTFWATWCASCDHEVPELIDLYDKYKDDNAVIVGLAIDNADEVRDYVKRRQINYPVLIGGHDALELSKQMGNEVGGLPYTLVINPQGQVVETILGATEKGELTRKLSPYLG